MVWWEKQFKELAREKGSSFRKLAWDEVLRIYFEHQAFDDPDLYKFVEKKINKKGNTIFQAENDDLVNKLEELVGDDNIEEAKSVLNDYYSVRVKELKERGFKV